MSDNGKGLLIFFSVFLVLMVFIGFAIHSRDEQYKKGKKWCFAHNFEVTASHDGPRCMDRNTRQLFMPVE